MKNRTSYHILRASLLMLLSFLLVWSIILPVFSSTNTKARDFASPSQMPELDIPSAVGTTFAQERGHIMRLRASEHDLNTVVFRNANQTQTMYIFDYPIKYIDASGKIQDISLEIADSQTEQGAFVTKAASIQTFFSKNLLDGVTITADDVFIRSIPVKPATGSITDLNAFRVDSKTIAYPYEANTSIEYSLTYRVIKKISLFPHTRGKRNINFDCIPMVLSFIKKMVPII